MSLPQDKIEKMKKILLALLFALLSPLAMGASDPSSLSANASAVSTLIDKLEAAMPWKVLGVSQILGYRLQPIPSSDETVDAYAVGGFVSADNVAVRRAELDFDKPSSRPERLTVDIDTRIGCAPERKLLRYPMLIRSEGVAKRNGFDAVWTAQRRYGRIALGISRGCVAQVMLVPSSFDDFRFADWQILSQQELAYTPDQIADAVQKLLDSATKNMQATEWDRAGWLLNRGLDWLGHLYLPSGLQQSFFVDDTDKQLDGMENEDFQTGIRTKEAVLEQRLKWYRKKIGS
jgi:hypothetical protein